MSAALSIHRGPSGAHKVCQPLPVITGMNHNKETTIVPIDGLAFLLRLDRETMDAIIDTGLFAGLKRRPRDSAVLTSRGSEQLAELLIILKRLELGKDVELTSGASERLVGVYSALKKQGFGNDD